MSSQEKFAVFIDPPSHHFLNDRLFTFAGNLGDNLMAPHVAVYEYFMERNIPIHTADLMPGTDDNHIKVYLSLGILDNYRKMAERPDVIVSSFFAMECPIVDPGQYRKMRDAKNYFRHIYSWSDSESLERFIGEKIPIETFQWPQSYDHVHEELWSNNDRKFLMMMNSNKLPALYWQELYTERMRAIEYFSRTNEIDLYGREWDQPSMKLGKSRMPYTFRKCKRDILKYWQILYPDPLLYAARKVYKGAADSKSSVLSQYNFAICFENMIIKGWVTEKIFDCFFSGTIPVYLGSPDIEQRIPAECYIDMRKFKDYPSLHSYLKSLTQVDIFKYRNNARAFLESEAFTPHTKQAFVNTIVSTIELDIDNYFRNKQSKSHPL